MTHTRHVLAAVLTTGLHPAVALAQGIGPPPGMEGLLYIYLGLALIVVGVLTGVGYRTLGPVLLGRRPTTKSEKVLVFFASLIGAFVVLAILVIGFDIR